MSDHVPDGSRKLLLRGVVHRWHEDHFGHMNVRWYSHFFDDAVFFAMDAFGLNLKQMQDAYGVHTVSANATLSFVKELRAGDLISIDGCISRLGNKSITFELRMLHQQSEEVHATYDLVEVFFDPATRKSTEMPNEIRRRLEKHVAAN